MSRVLTMVAGLVAGIITARALGVEGRGMYFYVVTIALLASQLANLGLPSSNAYFSAQDRTLVLPLLYNSFWISLILGPIAVAAIVGVNSLVSEASPGFLGELSWAFLIAPCALFYLLSTNLLVGIQEFGRYNAISVASTLLQLLLLIVLAIAWPTVHGFLAASVVALFFGGVVVARETFKIIPTEGNRHLNLPLLRRGMGFAARAFLILLFGYLLSRMPVIALALQGDIHSVGLVSIVVQFLDALLVLPSSVAMVLFPRLVSGQTKDGIPKTFNSTVWVVVIMAAVSSVLALVSTPLIVFMFGEAFRNSAEALRWALPGVVLLSAVNVFGQYLAAEGFPISTVLAWGMATATGYALAPSEPSADAAKYAAGALSCAYAVLAVAMAAIFARRLCRSRAEA